MPNKIARHLRSNQTIAERELWKELRKLRSQGFHFRRQVPIDTYIVDFACLSQRLIIEIDGIQHDEPDHRKKDAARDAHLEHNAFRVLRFRNGEVMHEREGVMRAILNALGVQSI
ncbi:MAG: endonuclease domain-containing protein [Hyphomicrobiaceae bacterium]